ncbi:hypothetical protein [Rhizobium sp. RU36D]|uniref:hypothetical protein n=1 Tax=Rhizobium sp. RU36D TaxID=1907415 RepID=UPI0009FF649E|nr:hypothetical protein [Rhizobium sp. RU36D]
MAPSVTRTILAFIIAPACAALILAFPFLFGSTGGVALALALWLAFASYGYIATLLFGVPAFLFLKKHIPLTPFVCGIAGALISVLPLALLRLLADGSVLEMGHATFLAAPGLLGGLFFWFLAFGMQKPRQ